jgi:hypothetical protein
LCGVVVYFGLVSPKLARDHEVIVQFPAPPTDVTRADIVWTDPSVHAGEPVAGATYYFPDKGAPRELRSVVHVPEGIYTMDLTLDGVAGSKSITRALELRGDTITVFLNPAAPPDASGR